MHYFTQFFAYIAHYIYKNIKLVAKLHPDYLVHRDYSKERRWLMPRNF